MTKNELFEFVKGNKNQKYKIEFVEVDLDLETIEYKEEIIEAWQIKMLNIDTHCVIKICDRRYKRITKINIDK